MYALFKPLMEKGLPYLWDVENRLLKKEQYENLIVAKRNDHSHFDDLEGNLRGEVLVVKLGDIFDFWKRGLSFLAQNLRSTLTLRSWASK